MTPILPILSAACLMLSLTSITFAQESVDDVAQDYVSEKSFEPMALENIEGALSDLLGGEDGGMLTPGADISPIETALLILDTQEEPLSRLRYVLRYNQRSIEGVETSFIDVQRYNLGPAIRLDAIEAYGAENVAEPEIFGVGPHVAWRFVTVPSAKSAAVLVAAGRREIAEATAETTNCLVRTCLSFDTLDEYADWQEWTQMDEDWLPVAYPREVDFDGEEIVPAYQALELAVAAGIATADDTGVLWTMPDPQGPDTDSPFLVVLIDRNLGQEIMSDAAMGIGVLGKDGEERWTRISGGVFGGIPIRNLTTATGPLVRR